MKKKDFYNAEGYADPTPYQAQKNIEEERARQRMTELIAALKRSIDAAGFDLVARIKIKDRETGKVFK